MCNTENIKNVASSALKALKRVSLAGDGFTGEQIDAIAEAITAAIAEYDSQNYPEKS